MSVARPETLAELLLLRSGLLFLEEVGDREPAEALDENQQRAFHLELANLGYVASRRLSERAARASAAELVRARDLVVAARRKALGVSAAKLQPMFRQFPDGVPDDTLTLWWDRVIVHYLQQPEQPCLLCGRTGTIHVLDPCMDLVCERCFDGSNYSGCPICNRAVDQRSAFFRPAPERKPATVSSTTFALLELGNPTADRTVDAACRTLFTSLCLRTQVMSPVDVDSLLLLVKSYRGDLAGWIPAVLPVRENRALLFGTLLRGLLDDATAKQRPAPDLAPFFAAAAAHLTTATDVLRLIAVLSAANVALLAEPKVVPTTGDAAAKRFPKQLIAKQRFVAISHHRFKVARMPRALRRHLLALLDAIPQAQLFEDMSRHRSRWIWVAELLHPGEYERRYPGVARVFAILRNGQDARGVPRRPARPPRRRGKQSLPARILHAIVGNRPAAVPAAERPGPQTAQDLLAEKAAAAAGGRLRTWPSAVEDALARRATAESLALLSQRPGEFLRRFDLLLRRAADLDEARRAVEAFAAVAPRCATPALVALRAHMAVRAEKLPARIFWPKAAFLVPRPPADTRSPLAARVVAQVTRTLDAELVRRFAEKPAIETAILDAELAGIIVPFNERTASRSAVQLPRGSSVELPPSQALRLFMHWCEPQRSGGYDDDTDIDLSIAFFDARWNLVGTCAYYQLTAHDRHGQPLAKSSGDFTSAPWPDGSAEFVDFDRVRAREAGYRYAVMVVNAYSGLPFRELARATAGVMLRDDLTAGEAFDARTASLAFALDGANGVFMPLLVDLETSRLHWLDAYAKGQFQHNNVASSSLSIGRICPAMLSYFASGTRPSMLELARYHAAARCRRVFVRGQDSAAAFVRRPDETAHAFLERLRHGPADETLPLASVESRLDSAPVFAALLRGDLALPEGSSSYALFRQQLIPTLAAADLLS
jgi:Prokaryotic RING finger family 4